MTRSATEVMQEIIFSAVIDSIAALKSASKGMPNTLMRDLNSVHANTSFADLPKELQAAITASVRTAFNRLLKEGYSVSSSSAPETAPQRRPPPRQGPGDRPRPPGNRPGNRGPRPPRRER